MLDWSMRVEMLPIGLRRRTCVGILEAIQVDVEALVEGVVAEPIPKHADEGGSLGVGDGVENLTDLVGVLYVHLHRMGALHPVQRERLHHLFTLWV